jgi:hypothetical protein
MKGQAVPLGETTTTKGGPKKGGSYAKNQLPRGDR